MGTPFQDSSYSQYTCCLIFCRNRLWEGIVRLAWHVPSIAYCKLLKEILLLPFMNVQNTFTKQVGLVCDLYLRGTWFES